MPRTRILFATLTALAMAAAVSPAVAKPKHCPPGHAKKGWCSPGGGFAAPRVRNRVVAPNIVQPAETETVIVPAPTGPAWSVGEYMPSTSYSIIRNYTTHGWPTPRTGETYVLMDGRYYLIHKATGMILNLLLK